MKQPALFIGHGSPMGAIQKSKWSETLHQLGQKLKKPDAVLMISAHWETNGTRVSSNEKPKTIHDFYGFPPELYKVQYPASGDLMLCDLVHRLTGALPDSSWGFDHGAWSVMVHLFPKADIPMVQLSLDRNLNEEQHWSLAERLKPLREENVLIIGSGNIVHNLGEVEFSEEAEPDPRTIEFDHGIAKALKEHDKATLCHYSEKFPRSAHFAVPTNEHYLPMIYTAALAEKNEEPEFFYEGYQYRSLSMRSFGYFP